MGLARERRPGTGVGSMLAGSTGFGAGSAMGVVAVLAAAAFLAAWIPCHHAAQTEAMEALRTEYCPASHARDLGQLAIFSRSLRLNRGEVSGEVHDVCV